MLNMAPYVIATSLVVAALSVLLIDMFRGVLTRAQPTEAPRGEPAVRFLFDRDKIVDTTPSAELFLSRGGDGTGSLKTVLDLLGPRFPDAPAAIEHLGQCGQTRLLANDGSARLAISRNDETLRLDLESVAEPDRPYFVSAAEFKGLKDELQRLRGVADGLPYLVWCEDPERRLTWVNRAYLELCAKVNGPDAAERWPLPRLFEPPAGIAAGQPYSARLWVGSEDNGTPYEVSAIEHEGALLCSAIPAESAVRTETSMRDVLQTLTKTFAQISQGLAVFGRDRRLVLFNPALADLTGLRPEKLAVRPTLFEFLDLMRDRRMVPEPRDYRAWRAKLTDTAANGTGGMAESWALPDGRTFQVTALPQPEGATALLFEDITGQVVRNRSFRGTVELQQQLLDRRAEAMAVFAADGTLEMCNDTYDHLWQTDYSETLDQVRLPDQIGLWKRACAPDPAWDSFPASPASAAGAGWQAQLTTGDGRSLRARAQALPGGHLLVEFLPAVPGAPDLSRPPAHRLKLLA